MSSFTDGPLPANLVSLWEEFFRESHFASDVFDAGILFPLQRRRELHRMLSLAYTIKPTTIFEIGCDKAGTLLHWCCLSGIKRIIACEMRGTPYQELFEKNFPHIQFLWLPVSSYAPETVSRVKNWLRPSSRNLSDPIDVLFIDGDKNNFTTDFKLYSPMVRTSGVKDCERCLLECQAGLEPDGGSVCELCKGSGKIKSPGGIIFMHDILDDPTRIAFQRCRRDHEWAQLIDTTESIDIMEKVRNGGKPTTEHDNWLIQWRGGSAGCGVIWM